MGHGIAAAQVHHCRGVPVQVVILLASAWCMQGVTKMYD